MDELLAEYLETLSAYQHEMHGAVQRHLKQAFLHLARARNAMGLQHPSPALMNAPTYPQSVVFLDSVIGEPAAVACRLEPTTPAAALDKEANEMPASAYIDPIKRYTAMPPSSLRSAQHDFRQVIEVAVQRVTPLVHRIKALEAAISQMRDHQAMPVEIRINGPVDNVPAGMATT